MLVDITVYRGDGDKPGPDIQEPLASTNAVALAVGRNFLDEHSGLSLVTLTVAYNAVYEPGSIVEVVDSSQGVVWYGEIADVTHSLDVTGDDLLLQSTIVVSRRLV